MSTMCRERLKATGHPYPKSSCQKCGTLMRPGWRCAEGYTQPSPRLPPRTLFTGKYGADNADVVRHGDTLSVTLTYPPMGQDDEGKMRYVEVDQESVRASDSIRVHYDYERDGWSIEQASVFSWKTGDKVMDQGWAEVAFVPAWARDISRGGG